MGSNIYDEQAAIDAELDQLRQKVTIPYLPPIEKELIDEGDLVYTLVLDLDETLIHYECDEEEGDYFGNHFNVDLWNMYYNDDENVIDFINETYIGLKSLPQSVCD